MALTESKVGFCTFLKAPCFWGTESGQEKIWNLLWALPIALHLSAENEFGLRLVVWIHCSG